MYGNIFYEDLIVDKERILDERKEPMAYCNSSICLKDRGNASYGVLKKISKYDSFCPDCGYAVFWMRPKKGHARNNNIVAKKRSRYSGSCL